jgi:hypothetical protein
LANVHAAQFTAVTFADKPPKPQRTDIVVEFEVTTSRLDREHLRKFIGGN